MRTIQAIASILFACAALTLPAAASVPQTSVEQNLATLSEELMRAVERKDKRSLEQLVASDFTLQMPGEKKTVHRDEWIGNAIGKDWSKFHYDNLVARVHGDNAVVSSRLHFNVAPIPFGLDSGAVDTWERRGGRWQITGRYLGQSDAQQRIAFALGALGSVGFAAMAYALIWLVRRSRRRVR